MKKIDPEIHLFIVWEKARGKETEIVEDIKNKFEILDFCEVTWSDTHFSENLTRFYGEKLPSGSHKQRHCGTGSFLVIIVKDLNPIYSNRKTSKSRGVNVNVNIFDAKAQYRLWTGGGHKIHATNNTVESRHDITLLFGVNAERYFSNSCISNESLRYLACDLVGADKWNDIEELFYVLNNTVKYVVLRNYECLPKEYNMESHGDIDLLVSNYNEVAHVTNATKVFKSKRRVHNQIKIGQEDVLFDFRFIGDEYYDESWEKDILNRRIFNSSGFYTPEPKDYFFSLVYHAMVHKPQLAPDYKERLIKLANKLEVCILTDEMFENSDLIRSLLSKYLTENNYNYTEPYDLSVYFNERFTGRFRLSILRRFILEAKNLLRPIKNPVRLTKNIILYAKERILRLIG
jgi:hypothetical protein